MGRHGKAADGSATRKRDRLPPSALLQTPTPLRPCSWRLHPSLPRPQQRPTYNRLLLGRPHVPADALHRNPHRAAQLAACARHARPYIDKHTQRGRRRKEHNGGGAQTAGAQTILARRTMEEKYQTGEGASAQGYEPKKKRKKERSTKKRAPARNMHVFSPGCWKQTGSSKQVRRAHGGASRQAHVPLVVELGKLGHEGILIQEPHRARQRYSQQTPCSDGKDGDRMGDGLSEHRAWDNQGGDGDDSRGGGGWCVGDRDPSAVEFDVDLTQARMEQDCTPHSRNRPRTTCTLFRFQKRTKYFKSVLDFRLRLASGWAASAPLRLRAFALRRAARIEGSGQSPPHERGARLRAGVTAWTAPAHSDRAVSPAAAASVGSARVTVCTGTAGVDVGSATKFRGRPPPAARRRPSQRCQWGAPHSSHTTGTRTSGSSSLGAGASTLAGRGSSTCIASRLLRGEGCGAGLFVSQVHASFDL